MQLKNGMKVRIKTRKQAIKQYGLSNYSAEIMMPYGYVPSTMDALLNTVVTVNKTNYNQVTLKNIAFTWHKDMFKPLYVLSFKSLYKIY